MASQNLLNEDVFDNDQLIQSLENDKSLDKYFSTSIRLVLRKKFVVNQILNAEHQTPLHLAVAHQHFGIVEYLLKNKADVNAKVENDKSLDKYFSTSIQLVLQKKLEVNQILNAEHQTPLRLAVVHQHFGIVEYLLKNKTDVNAKGKNRKTPLHLACRNGNYKIAECLLLHATDPI